MTKTWIRFYDACGEKSHKEFTLNGKWSEASIKKFLEKKDYLKNMTAKITYL